MRRILLIMAAVTLLLCTGCTQRLLDLVQERGFIPRRQLGTCLLACQGDGYGPLDPDIPDGHTRRKGSHGSCH